MKVTLNYSENLHFQASARHFSDIPLDEPETFHGKDLGPSSIEYVLIGIGGCLGTTFVFCLQKHNIEIKTLQVIVNGTLKHIGPKDRLKLIKIEIQFEIDLAEETSIEDFEFCKTEFTEFCPLNDIIKSGIPLNVRIIKK